MVDECKVISEIRKHHIDLLFDVCREIDDVYFRQEICRIYRDMQ